jgi:putative glutamate/gamma-aminobutyrate antiporter
MDEKRKKLPRSISIFTLVMINVAAVGSIKSWPLIAEFGFSSIFYLLLSALIFLIPVSLVAAELATGWPKTGGVFVWVKEAFGHRAGFLAVWLLWLENVFWYPTVLSFIAATLAYLFNPTLADNPLFILVAVLIIIWLITFVNFFGMRTSGWISTIGALCGTYLPGLLIIALGLIWFFSGSPLQINFDWKSFLPNITKPKELAFFTGLLLTMGGMEMAAVHAGDVKHPKKDYPKALLFSVLSIVLLSTLGVLAIAIVIPTTEISLVSGMLQAFTYFFDAYHLKPLLPLLSIVIILGAIGALSTWLVGPSKGLLAAAMSGDLPPSLRKVNRHGMPVNLLILQAIIVSAFSIVFVTMPTLNSAYWISTVVAANLYLVMYIMMFSAAIKLRYKRPQVERSYRIPGGNFGIWFVAGVGLVGAFFTFIFGFLPPEQIPMANPLAYSLLLILGVLLGCLAPSIILWFKRPTWTHPEEQ